jgi:hypothetical protein
MFRYIFTDKLELIRATSLLNTVLKLFLPGCDVEANDVLKDEVDVDSNDQHSETDGKDFRSQTCQNIQIVTFL